jgi:hypothetical protein
VIVQAAGALELLQGGDRQLVERAALGAGRGKAGAGEATLQVADRLAVLSGD